MRMDLMGRDPYRELSELFDQWRFSGPTGQSQQRTASWTPNCDVCEDDNGITVVAELPGIKMEDINLEVTADALSISGERKFEQQEGKQWVRVERPYGTFKRSFSISIPIDVQAVKATYRDGLLTVNIPKAEEIKPKRISVEAG